MLLGAGKGKSWWDESIAPGKYLHFSTIQLEVFAKIWSRQMWAGESMNIIQRESFAREILMSILIDCYSVNMNKKSFDSELTDTKPPKVRKYLT